jgi:hypothetical protein
MHTCSRGSTWLFYLQHNKFIRWWVSPEALCKNKNTGHKKQQRIANMHTDWQATLQGTCWSLCQEHCNPNAFEDLRNVSTPLGPTAHTIPLTFFFLSRLTQKQIFSWVVTIFKITQHMRREHFWGAHSASPVFSALNQDFRYVYGCFFP